MTSTNDKSSMQCDQTSTSHDVQKSGVLAKSDIRSTLPEELETILVDELGEKKFRTAQILRWVFEKRAQSWD